jgi:hypothetical protein
MDTPISSIIDLGKIPITFNISMIGHPGGSLKWLDKYTLPTLAIYSKEETKRPLESLISKMEFEILLWLADL